MEDVQGEDKFFGYGDFVGLLKKDVNRQLDVWYLSSEEKSMLQMYK